MALHGGNLLAKANPVNESSAEYVSMNPESTNLHSAGPSSSTVPSGIRPPIANPKIIEVHSNGLIGTNNQPHGYPYSTYTSLRAVPQNTYTRGPVPTNVTSSDGSQSTGPAWAHVRAFRPRTGGSFPLGTAAAAGSQDRVFRVCDPRVQPKGVTTFQVLGNREAVYMIGPKPTTAMNEAGGLEHPVVVSRASFAKPACGGSSPDGVVQPGPSGMRRQWPDRRSATMTTNEAEIKCPPTASSVMSSSSMTSSVTCQSESSSSSSTERRQEKSGDGKRQKLSSASVACMSPVSDCEVEAAASTTSADGGNSCKFLGDDSSSRELVSSSTATNDAFGNVADSSTSTVERKSTKKSSSKPKPGVNILGKIAALGTEPDRQQFLEDLFAFMEYRGTPITTVPVICRQTVDLFRLYHHVKERSGMVEVSKGKRWRDVGSAMGIGGSTSAGFTLKRNYGRFLFPYECKFDRGDVDPAPLLAAMETPSRKDSRRRTAERERDREIEMDESQSSCSQQQTPTRQTTRNNGFTTTHGLSGYNIETTDNDDGLMNSPISGFQGLTGYKMGFTGSAGNQSSIEPTESPGLNEQRSEFSTLQPMQVTNSYALHSMQCVRSSGGDFGRALAPAAVPVESPMAAKMDEEGSNGGYGSSMSTAGLGVVTGDRSDETSIVFPNILQSTLTSASDMEIAGNAKLVALPRIESAETRFRDVDSRASNGLQGTSVQAGIVRLGNFCDPGATLRTGQPSLVGSATRGNCDGELPNSASFCQQYQTLVDGMAPASSSLSSSAAEAGSSAQQHQHHPFAASQVVKRLQFPKSEVGAGSLSVLRCEMQFPLGSVEAKRPVLKKRKTLTHRDIGPIDPWGIMMSLRSGLISESTWALDVLSVLLRDDFTASAFGLSHVPGLLEVVVEHFRRCLIEIFGAEYFGDLETFVPRKDTLSETKYSPTIVSQNGILEKHEEVGRFPGDDVDDRLDQNDPACRDMFESSAIDWQLGHGETTVHIITHMSSDDGGFHERQFFGKNLDILKRKRSKSDKCVGKGFLTAEESENLSGNARKLQKATEVAQRVDIRKSCDEISVACEPESNVFAKNNEKMGESEQEKHCVASLEKDSVCQNSFPVEISTASRVGDGTTDKLEKESSFDSCREESLNQKTVHQNSSEIDLSTAFCADGIQLFTCNHLDSMKRMYGEMGEEVVQPEQTLIHCWDESKSEVAQRCLCLSNILRNLSLISGNESEMSRHRGLVLVLSRLLLLHHYHRMSKDAVSLACSERRDGGKNRWWWWETLVKLRENSLVVLASIAGQTDLSLFPASIGLPLLDGLLHWSICRSAEAQDPFPGSSLSVGNLVLETLCKLCVTRANVDLVIATPPFARIVLLLSHLANLVGDSHPQVTRELALGLMSRLVKADTSAARALALERSAFSFLLEFIEGAEHQARLVANTQGIEILQDFPETIGTSVDMLCRAANVLLCLAHIPANLGILSRFHHRLLHLVMSQILDCKVTAILAQVLGTAAATT